MNGRTKVNTINTEDIMTDWRIGARYAQIKQQTSVGGDGKLWWRRLNWLTLALDKKVG